jgi:hypothetical protein
VLRLMRPHPHAVRLGNACSVGAGRVVAEFRPPGSTTEYSHRIPRMPASHQDNGCPKCQRALTDPGDQQFTQIGAPTFKPSKICETCKVGYWLSNSGWVAVATFT